MRIFDASSIIYAWDNYPLEKFPGLWNWIANQIKKKEFGIVRVAWEEVKAKTPDCEDWLTKAGIVRINETNEILMEAVRIKKLLDIENDRYGSGVGENDLIIIATAKEEKFDLISDESRQLKLPTKKPNYKIPAVCDLPSVGVRCLNFIELIKDSDAIF